jgi:ATP synthase protein I
VETEPAVTPNVEREIALDLVKHGLPVAPVVILIGGLVGGWAGAASAALAVGIVLVNFLIAAAIMTRAAKHGPGAIGGAALGSYVVRLAVIVIALALLRHESWINLPVLGFVLVGTYLGLLFWEAKYVSLTLAAPGLRPAGPGPAGER